MALSRASMAPRCADQSMRYGATSATDITATSATAMMVRIVRTGKRLPLRLDELSQERFGDHRGSKCRESMALTTKAASCGSYERLGNGNRHADANTRAGG